ncbi:PA-phosphatase related-family protein [Phytophthora ramorum]|uniref:PA-phosphatase related-family protein n=1 Tax=Phytophthora ramorum TaxID=164328 RepID=UPI0030AD6890|nr:PA-phosphatase related-family protein [Phytophthora ramorum]
MESITSVSELPALGGPESRPRSGGKWERLARDYRAAEFGISVLMYGFALFFAKSEVAQREIPNIEVQLNSTTSVWARDPTINNKEKTQQVPMIALVGIGVGAPIIINLFINYALPKFRSVRIIPHDTRDFFLTIVQSTSMATLLTQFTKNMTGRFRPCFYDMCKWNHDVVWDGVTNLCTSASGEKEGRKSFPSGHASFAFATMLVLTLYLLGRSTLNCENRSETMMRGGRKTLKLFLCFIPTFLAAWVAVTRTIDNWHHYADILAGSIIGAVSACISYSFNYASIFHSQHAGVPLQGCHASCKQDKLTSSSSGITYASSGSLSTDQGSELGKPNVRGDYVMNVHANGFIV